MSEPIDRLNSALADRYRIQRELGQGGMATVYLADDVKHRRKVAIKVLKPELAAVVGAERFLAEIQTTANLQHPHILPLFDSGEANGHLFYVMPYVEGESLRDRLNRERQLPVEEAVRIACDVAEALYAAHERGVIHRDIKPANVLLSGGRPLVADFGIALAVSNAGGGRLTETGLSLGTPHYMSPEQASADRDPTPASDQYSLACVLYEMLVGEPPFSGGTAQAVLARILTGDPEPPSTLRKSVPPNVDAVVMRGLQRLPADRFPDAREMVRALRDTDHRYATAGTRGSSPTGKGGLDSLLPWGTAAVLAALLVLGFLRGGRSPADRAPIRVAIPMAEESLIPLGPLGSFGNDEDAFDVSPDGRTLVHLGWDGEEVQLYRRPLDSYESVVFPGTEGAFAPFVSPDGRWVGYFADGGLWKVAMDGGDPIRLSNASNSSGGFWRHDDRIVFSTMEGARLLSVSALGGKVATEGTAYEYWAPLALPGGKGLIVTGGTPSQIYLLSPDGDRRSLGLGSQPAVHPSGHLTFVRGRTLYAASMDLESYELTTPPVPVLEGIRSQGSARSHRLTDDGALFYLPGVFADVVVPALIDVAGVADTLPIPPGNYGHLAISPDLDRVATYQMSTDFEMLVFDLTSERVQLIDRAPALGQAIWSRAGDRIAYGRRSSKDDSGEVVVRVPESTVETVLLRTDFSVSISDWAPGDTHLLYAEWTDSAGAQTWIVPLDGDGSPELILGDPEADEWGAVLSPDGRWLAYTSDRSGTYEIYLTPFPTPAGEGATKISAHPTSEEPHWSFQGDAVLYRSGGQWWRVPIRFTPDPVPGAPELVAQGSFVNVPGKSWDLLPDGRFLMGDGPRDSTVNRINMIPNFVDEMEHRITEAGR